MANTLTGRSWRIDVTGAVATTPHYVKSVKWVNEAGVAGANAKITDPKNGATLYEDVCAGANFASSELVETWWSNGFTITTLDSGFLLIELG